MMTRMSDVNTNKNTSASPSYKEGNIITWNALSSTSPDMTVTKTFLAKGSKSGRAAGTLFIINNGWGYDIQPYSLFPTESEILVEPERQFKVVSVIQAELTIVKLEMLKTPILLPDIYGRHDLRVPPLYFIKKRTDKNEKKRERERDDNRERSQDAQVATTTATSSNDRSTITTGKSGLYEILMEPVNKQDA